MTGLGCILFDIVGVTNPVTAVGMEKCSTMIDLDDTDLSILAGLMFDALTLPEIVIPDRLGGEIPQHKISIRLRRLREAGLVKSDYGRRDLESGQPHCWSTTPTGEKVVADAGW